MNIVIYNFTSDTVYTGFYDNTAGPGFNNSANINSQVTLNTWVNIQVTWDGTNLLTYINGLNRDHCSMQGPVY